MKPLFESLKENKKTLAILFFITLAGIFLRTYHFKEDLVFAIDQERDLHIVTNVVQNHVAWPLLGPDMTDGHNFRLGPAYYYFQILSAKIFGVSREHQAYPDVFFSILSIPLLYYFLRRCSCVRSSLLVTGVYAFSFFDIRYSRFAWNVNLLPFFVLLFLTSFWQFLLDDEDTSWRWIVLVSFSLGIGVQLHAITLVLLPAVVFGGTVFIFFVKKKRPWKKLMAVILLTLLLNTGQIISELKNNFSNTRDFQDAFVAKSSETSFLKESALDVACNVQANAYAISALGNQKMCDFLYGDHLRDSSYSTPIHIETSFWPLLGEIMGFLFTTSGIIFLIFYFLKEPDKKRKYFLGLIIFYGILYFLIMIPVAPGSRIRYYLPIIFLPFLFLSFIFDYLGRKFPRQHVWIISTIFIFLLITNAISIYFKFQHPLRLPKHSDEARVDNKTVSL